jgi:hypothetical protein
MFLFIENHMEYMQANTLYKENTVFILSTELWRVNHLQQLQQEGFNLSLFKYFSQAV